MENDAYQKKATWSKDGQKQKSAPNKLACDLKVIIAGYREVGIGELGAQARHNRGKRGRQVIKGEGPRDHIGFGHVA